MVLMFLFFCFNIRTFIFQQNESIFEKNDVITLFCFYINFLFFTCCMILLFISKLPLFEVS